LLLVESPNDEFQLVRDFVDVSNFHSLKTFDKEKFKKLHYQEMVEEFKEHYKVNQVCYNLRKKIRSEILTFMGS